MEKEKNIYKPKSLPQLSAPFSYVAHQLNDMGQPYELVGANVDSINPSQAFIDTDIVSNLVDKLKNGEELKAIWLDKDNNALDGHHRYAAYALNQNSHIPSVRLGCDKEKAIEILNEIQAMYEKENSSPFISALFEDQDTSMYIPDKKLPTKKETVKGYRKNKIVQKSITGNFFALKPVKGYKIETEITFSSLLNSDDVNPKIKDDKNPPAALAKEWFPTLDLKEKAKLMGMTEEQFINAIVAEKARTKGIDGIKYGDKLLQSIDDK